MPYGIVLSHWVLAELLLAVSLVLLALARPDSGRGIWVRGMLAARWLERRPFLMLALAGALPVLVRIALLPIHPAPLPYVMEEHNHIFLTDTYLLGRVANPVHPLAVMLQTYQQVEWPTYVSARPPLPPVFLAIGKLLFGSAFAGNLLAVGLTSAALCWALQGWVSGRLAALASFLAITTFCLYGYWINSFWAPTTIALGGALLFGAAARLAERPTFAMAFVSVIAIALLAGTRPFENGVFAAVVFGWLAWRYLQADRRALIGRAVVVAGVPIMIGTAGILVLQAWYNQETTGNPLIMPYQIWRVSQDMTPNFLWEAVGPRPHFFNEGAARFAEWNMAVANLVRNGGIRGVAYLFSRHAVTFRDLLGPFLFLAFACWSPRWVGPLQSMQQRRIFTYGLCASLVLLAICGPYAGSAIKLIALAVLIMRWADPVANPNDRLAVLVIVAGMIATSLSTFYMNIYFAAYTAPLLVLVASGLGNLSRWNSRLGKSLAGFVLLGASLVPLGQSVNAAFRLADMGFPQFGPPLSRFDIRYPSPHHEVTAKLAQLPGKHIVFMSMGRALPDSTDPVWNKPEVDAQKVVWLRDLRPEWTAAAYQYYTGRTFWRLDLREDGKYTLRPYPTRDLGSSVPLASLPNPDQVAAEAIGARPIER